MTPEQDRLNLRFALEIAKACLDRVNDDYGKGLQIIDPDDEDRTLDLDRRIEDWGIQGTINELMDALDGKILEDGPGPTQDRP